MKFSTYRFTLDLQKHQSQLSIACSQYDSAIRLNISLTDGGNPYFISDGCSAVLYGKKPNGTPIIHNCMIEGNTRIVYDFNELTASEIGVVNCQIRLYKSGKELITAPRFIIVVDERLVQDVDIDLGENAYLYKKDVAVLDEIISSEQQRVENENQRIANEATWEGRINNIAESVNGKVDKVTDSNILYGTDLIGNPHNYGVGVENLMAVPANVDANKVVLRDMFGGIRVPADISEDELVDSSVLPKKYIDEKSKGKVNKITTKGNYRLYSINTDGETVERLIANSPGNAANGSVPIYFEENYTKKDTLPTTNLLTGIPYGEASATPRIYVDNLVNPLEKRVEQLESATMDYVLDKSTVVEKLVPVRSGMYARLKALGGASYRPRISGNILVSTELGGSPSGGASVDAKGDVTHTSASGDHCYLWTGELSAGIYDYEIVMSQGTFFKCHLGQVNEYDSFNSTTTLDGTKGEFTVTDGQRLAIEFEGESDDNYVNSYAKFKIALFEKEKAFVSAKVSEIESIGAQLIPFPYYDGGVGTIKTVNGVTFKVNADETVTANGTATGQGYFIIYKGVLPIGTYCLSGCPRTDVQSTQIYIANANYSFYKVDAGNGVSFSITKEELISVTISISKGTTVNNLMFAPMLNKGTEIAPRKPYQSEPVDTIEISEDTPVLLGVNENCYDYFEFTSDGRVLYHKKVEEVDLGSLTWTADATSQAGYRRYLADFSLSKAPASNSEIANILCAKYISKSSTDVYLANEGIAISTTGKVCIFDSLFSKDTLANFTNAMQGVKMYYELANPPEPEDITADFTEDNELIVQGGGAIRCKDKNDNVVEAPVPSAILFNTRRE